jgi:hypothetical protein
MKDCSPSRVCRFSRTARIIGAIIATSAGGQSRDNSKLPPSIEQKLHWADEHYARTGSWPTAESSRIPDSCGENGTASNSPFSSVPDEFLVVGRGDVEMVETSLNAVRRPIVDHRRFLFVAKEPRECDLLTVGHALAAWKFAVIRTH